MSKEKVVKEFESHTLYIHKESKLFYIRRNSDGCPKFSGCSDLGEATFVAMSLDNGNLATVAVNQYSLMIKKIA